MYCCFSHAILCCGVVNQKKRGKWKTLKPKYGNGSTEEKLPTSTFSALLTPSVCVEALQAKIDRSQRCETGSWALSGLQQASLSQCMWALCS